MAFNRKKYVSLYCEASTACEKCPLDSSEEICWVICDSKCESCILAFICYTTNDENDQLEVPKEQFIRWYECQKSQK